MKREELQRKRAQAVAYMKAMGLLPWKSEREIDLTPIEKDYRLQPGTEYHGLPYVNEIDGSLEEFEACLENGVYQGPVDKDHCVGVDCSSAVLAAWGTVASSFDYVWTKPMMPYSEHGSLPVGDYVIPPDATDSAAVVEGNDRQTLFRSYALLKPGDAVITYTKTGHVRMVAEMPVIRREEDGSIDETSTLVTHEIWVNTHRHGSRQTCWFLSRTYTFRELEETFYLPVTCREFATGRFEPVELTLSEPLRLSAEGLHGRLACNYRIYAVEAAVWDGAGRPVRRVRRHPLNTVDLKMVSKSYDLAELNEVLDLSSLPPDAYALTLRAKAAGEWHPIVTVPLLRREEGNAPEKEEQP